MELVNLTSECLENCAILNRTVILTMSLIGLPIGNLVDRYDILEKAGLLGFCLIAGAL